MKGRSHDIRKKATAHENLGNLEASWNGASTLEVSDDKETSGRRVGE